MCAFTNYPKYSENGKYILKQQDNYCIIFLREYVLYNLQKYTLTSCGAYKK